MPHPQFLSPKPHGDFEDVRDTGRCQLFRIFSVFDLFQCFFQHLFVNENGEGVAVNRSDCPAGSGLSRREDVFGGRLRHDCDGALPDFKAEAW